MTGIIEVVVIWSVIGAMGGGAAIRKIYKKIKAKRAIKNKAKIEKKRLKKYIQKISEIEMTSKKSNDLCVICQEDFKENNERAKLYCGHKFHLCCIKEWMNHKMTCPLCNQKLKKHPKKEKKAIKKIIKNLVNDVIDDVIDDVLGYESEEEQ